MAVDALADAARGFAGLFLVRSPRGGLGRAPGDAARLTHFGDAAWAGQR
jgi:hypothetical protein